MVSAGWQSPERSRCERILAWRTREKIPLMVYLHLAHDPSWAARLTQPASICHPRWGTMRTEKLHKIWAWVYTCREFSEAKLFLCLVNIYNIIYNPFLNIAVHLSSWIHLIFVFTWLNLHDDMHRFLDICLMIYLCQLAHSDMYNLMWKHTRTMAFKVQRLLSNMY